MMKKSSWAKRLKTHEIYFALFSTLYATQHTEISAGVFNLSEFAICVFQVNENKRTTRNLELFTEVCHAS